MLRRAMLAVLVSGAVACGLALMMGIMHLSSKRRIMMGYKEDKPPAQVWAASVRFRVQNALSLPPNH